MVRKRGVSFSPANKKKRLESPRSAPVNQEKSILNDGLLNLYKKDLIDKDNVSEDRCDLMSETQGTAENVEKLKTPARAKRRKNASPVARNSKINFDDVGGMPETLREVRFMFSHHRLPKELQKVKPVRGILLHGPPGCGKTHFALAIAGELQLPILHIEAAELVNGISGESENKICEAFDTAVATGRCILFLDNVQAICLKGSDNPMINRMNTTLQRCFFDLEEKDVDGRVMVIGATNQLESVGLRSSDCFSREVPIGMPDEEARLQILEVLCRNSRLLPQVSLPWLAKSTPGYVGGDLKNLVTFAEQCALNRLFEQIQSSSEPDNSDNPQKKDRSKLSSLEKLKEDRELWDKLDNIPQEVLESFRSTEDDFKSALENCVPVAQKEGFAPVDSVTWDDIGALADIKQELQQNIVWPIKYSAFFDKHHLSTPKGILLFGPKGCGKTLVAKAIANECNLNFLSVSGPELLSMYVGESERAIRTTFERARNSAPCVIFFDEFDGLCPNRSNSKDNAVIERVVNQLLCSSDGTRGRKQVFLVAATNRLDKIDSAMLRPGRLEKVYYVGLPCADGRADILRSLTKKSPKIAGDLPLETIAHDSRCEDFSGADLAHLIRAATTIAFQEIVAQTSDVNDDLCNKDFILTLSHFNQALDVVKPSISEEDRRYFKKQLMLMSGQK